MAVAVGLLLVFRQDLGLAVWWLTTIKTTTVAAHLLPLLPSDTIAADHGSYPFEIAVSSHESPPTELVVDVSLHDQSPNRSSCIVLAIAVAVVVVAAFEVVVVAVAAAAAAVL
jgi:hypothetical protein